MAKTFHVDIVSAEGEIFSGEAAMVFAPAAMGDIGIAPRHAPLLTTLRPGEVRVQMPGGEEQFFFVGGAAEEEGDGAEAVDVGADDDDGDGDRDGEFRRWKKTRQRTRHPDRRRLRKDKRKNLPPFQHG